MRDGSGAALAGGGSLGGSQAGARLLYRITPRLALSGRAYAPLEDRGAEAALGLDWQPVAAVPIRLLVERRQRLDRAGRSAASAMLYGGFSERRIAGPLLVDAYGQAGFVGLESRDAFVDGSVRVSAPIGASIRVGVGAWAAAQPRVERLDLGPQASLRLPVRAVNLRLLADYRFRVAGDAAPGSGPTVALATDF